MFIDFTTVRIFIRPGHTDMRKQAAGLSLLVTEEMQLDPFSQHLFFFCNKRRNVLKAVYWDKNGFCLWQLCEASHNCHYVKKDIMRRKMKKQAGAPGIL